MQRMQKILKHHRFVVEQPTPRANGKKISVLIRYGKFEIIPSAIAFPKSFLTGMHFRNHFSQKCISEIISHRNAFPKSFLTGMHSKLIFSLVKNESFSCAEFLLRAKKLFVDEMNKNKNDIGFIKEPNFRSSYTRFALIVIFLNSDSTLS